MVGRANCILAKHRGDQHHQNAPVSRLSNSNIILMQSPFSGPLLHVPERLRSAVIVHLGISYRPLST